MQQRKRAKQLARYLPADGSSPVLTLTVEPAMDFTHVAFIEGSRLFTALIQDGKAAKDAKKQGGSSKAAPAPDRPVDIARLDLRVGQIAKVWRHPAADRCAPPSSTVLSPGGDCHGVWALKHGCTCVCMVQQHIMLCVPSAAYMWRRWTLGKRSHDRWCPAS